MPTPHIDSIAAGGVRFWRYANPRDAMTDALRLSRGMSYKNAMAGLPMGGVAPAHLEAATRLIESATAEVKLFSVHSSCKAIACATLADTGQRNALENALKRATLLEVDADLLADARFVLKRLDAEIELQQAAVVGDVARKQLTQVRAGRIRVGMRWDAWALQRGPMCGWAMREGCQWVEVRRALP